MTVIYGIKNCDTMKKAFKWLESRDIDFKFHDYKKDGLDEGAFNQAIKEHGWETVINKRGTTWRQLSDAQKEGTNDSNAIKIARKNPSVVKRPLLLHAEKPHIGFKPEMYERIFS